MHILSCEVLLHKTALQIEAEFKRFSKYLDPEVRIANYVGGIARKLNEDELKDSSTRPHIIIGTPGRLMDLVEKGKLPLKDIKFFIIDECDKVLDQLGVRHFTTFRDD